MPGGPIGQSGPAFIQFAPLFAASWSVFTFCNETVEVPFKKTSVKIVYICVVTIGNRKQLRTKLFYLLWSLPQNTLSEMNE